jgi:hypothetical protein
MYKKILICLSFLPLQLLAQDTQLTENASDKTPQSEVKKVHSPEHRVAMLELYTSEGCSSCPPAEKFFSELKTMANLEQGIGDQQLVSLAFHVTYWDYIGWKDRFANSQFDQRQRSLANKNNKKSVYTPQFVFSGDDYRRYSGLSDDIKRLLDEKATVDLEITAQFLSQRQHADELRITLKSELSENKSNEVGLYIAVLENNLTSQVSSGENNGRLLHHDYVVRQLYGPYFHAEAISQLEIERVVMLQPEWKKQDLSVVAFAENELTGEILQAVNLAL